jgi:hypothetical protein
VYFRRAAALLLVFGSVWLLSPQTSAQLGSLVVTITAPQNGATVSGTTPFSASVTIVGVLTVGKVEFYRDGVLVGEDTAAPYSINWDTRTTSNGSHTLTAIGRSLLGVGFGSPSVSVTVLNDSTPPAVAITSPAAGANLRGALTIAAAASDNVGVAGVQFRLDGANFGAEDTTAPYSIPWNTATAANGSHTVTAIARDAAGNTTTAASIAVVVDNVAPAVAITSPAAASLVRGSITITANASDNILVAGVRFFVDGAPVGGEDLTAPYAADWATTGATNGTHTLTAVARDAAGNVTTSAGIALTVDNAGPAVSVTSPGAGSTVSGPIAVTAGATDNVAVAGVQFMLDGAMLGGEDTTAPYSADWDTRTSSNSSHTLTAVARDTAGNVTTSAAVAVNVANDTTVPTVAITSPAPGAALSNTVTVIADATDNVGVSSVQFFVDGAALGPEVTAAPYSASWNTRTVSGGAHTLTAVARDNAGNTATSAAVSVTVTNVTVTRVEDSNPAITYAPPGNFMLGYTDARPWSGGTAALGFAAGGRATLNFTGSGVSWIGFRGPQTGIGTVHLDGALVATVDAYSPTESNGAALYAVSGLPEGPHTITIEVLRLKNDASSDYFVIIDAFDVMSSADPDAAAPSVSISSPAAGATVSGSVALAATAADNIAVAGVRFFVNGAAVGAEDTAAPYQATWNTFNATNGSHTLTAVARDAAGNTTTSAAVSVTVSNTAPPPPPPTAPSTRIEDTDIAAITYQPGTPAPGQPDAWFHGSRSRVWSDQTSSFNRSAGARATVAFTGTGIKWIGFRSFWAGIARVYLDGTFISEVDLFLPRCTPAEKAAGCIDEDDEAVAFAASGLTAGPHTLTVEVTGTRNPAAEDNAVVIDAFDILPPTPPTVIGTRIEDTAMTYTGAWTQGDTTAPWSGGSAAISSTAGARATVSFTGTEARWVGRRGPQAGIARVYLDGAFQAEIDQYFASDVQAVIYTTTGLAPGRHTLTIEVTTLKNSRSTGTVAVIDAVDVRSRFEDRAAEVTYTGTWQQENMARSWSGQAPNNGGGTAARSNTAGARAEFTFNGTEVRFISMRWPSGGIADISLDGALVESVDLYSPVELTRAVVFTATGLAAGPHTLRVDVTGLKNGASGGAFVFVDAFDVVLSEPAPAITRVQQTDPAVAYTTPPSTVGFEQSSANYLFSGRTVAFTTTSGARASFTFTGTGVRWVGQRRRDGGIAQVYLDGVPIGLVDTWAPTQDEMQAAVFSATGLAPGTHTLTIEVTGTKRGGASCAPGPDPACSGGYLVLVDAFDIYP